MRQQNVEIFIQIGYSDSLARDKVCLDKKKILKKEVSMTTECFSKTVFVNCDILDIDICFTYDKVCRIRKIIMCSALQVSHVD